MQNVQKDTELWRMDNIMTLSTMCKLGGQHFQKAQGLQLDMFTISSFLIPILIPECVYWFDTEYWTDTSEVFFWHSTRMKCGDIVGVAMQNLGSRSSTTLPANF